MSVTCDDLLSVAVQAILNLGVPSSEGALLGAMGAICPGVTLLQVQAALSAGLKRGVLLSCTIPPDPTVRFEINADMRGLKTGNDRYYAIVDPTILAPQACPAAGV
jgi:hypothetical protein